MASHLDIPYNKLGNIRDKVPLNYCVLKLPEYGKGGSGGGAEGKVYVEPTTSFDEAVKGEWGRHALTGPMKLRAVKTNPKLRDVAFAKWEVEPLPTSCNLATALNIIAKANGTDKRALKYKIRFCDASELTFTRSEPSTAASLAFTNSYLPNTAFDKLTKSHRNRDAAKPLLNPSNKFLVNLQGHHIKRKGNTKLPTVGRQGSGIAPLTTSSFPTSAQRKELFHQIDPNGNGMLSLAELDKGVGILWPEFNNKPAIMRAYKAADVNGTGFIAKREFRLFLKYLYYYNQLWKKYSKGDADGDRRITLKELQNMSGSLGLSQDDAENAFNTMDRNKGGVVLFDEFAMWMAKNRADKELGSTLQSAAMGNSVSYNAHSGRLSSSTVSSRRSVSSTASTGKRAKLPNLHYPTPQDRAALFDRLDPNGNGLLSLAELDKAVVELWPAFNNKPALMRAYKAADRSGNGWIGKREFRLFLKFLVSYTEMWNVFRDIDTSGDRRITKQELVRSNPSIPGLPGLDIAAAFDEIDKNKVFAEV